MARLRFSFIIKSLAFAGALCAAGCASDVRPNEADVGTDNQGDVTMVADNPPAMDVVTPPADSSSSFCRRGDQRVCLCPGDQPMRPSGVQVCSEDREGFDACVCPMPDAGSVDTGNPMPDVAPACTPACSVDQTCAQGRCVSNCQRACVGRETCVLTASDGWSCQDLTPPDASVPFCRPGDGRQCLCLGDDPGRPSGVQVCNGAMNGYDNCRCPTRDAGLVDTGIVDASTDVVIPPPDVAVDAPLACEMGRSNCDGNAANGCEVNTLNDEMNCGRCGGTCPARANSAPLCNGGRCDFVCALRFANCNGSLADGCETDTRTSVTNCGACGTRCPARPHAVPTCAASFCEFTCDVGFADCNGNPVDGCEVDLNTTAAHCGRCDNACPGGSTCGAGACNFTCNPTDAGVVLTSCSGSAVCINLASNLGNCGACGNVCPTGGNGHPVCTASQCRSACNAGFADCDSLAANGCEIQTLNNAAHCGRCGNACATRPNSAPACVNSACGFTCNAGYGDCNYYANDGCEAPLATDVNNCGACFRACQPGQSCSNGTCVGAPSPECPTGQTNCGSRSRPLCYNLTNDPDNCGGCGYWCNGNQTCTAGNCRACPTGQVACDNVCRDIQSDNSNCGACGRICPTGQSCNAGACVTPCPTGQTLCTGTCRDTSNDVNNCGACGNRCWTGAGSYAACVAGACAFYDCVAGRGNCNTNYADACEVNLLTDSNNCGACYNRCPSGTVCTSGTCVSTAPVDAGTPDAGTPDAGIRDVSPTDVGSVDGTPGAMGPEFADVSVADGHMGCATMQGNVVAYDPMGVAIGRGAGVLYSTARRLDITSWPTGASICFDFDCNGRQLTLPSSQLGRSGTEIGWTISTNRVVASSGGPLGRIDHLARVINTPFGVKLCTRFDGTTITSF